MPSSYTPLLGLVQPVTGELVNTWGSVLNTQLTQLVEDAIANSVSVNVTAGDWTLTTTAGGAQNEARNAILIVTGTPGTTRYINAPKQSKLYVVINNSNALVYLRGGPTSPTAGSFVSPGQSALLAWDAGVADFVKVAGGSGGAKGGGTDQIFFENGQAVTVDYTIPAATNAGTFGPIVINSGISVTVTSGSNWAVI